MRGDDDERHSTTLLSLTLGSGVCGILALGGLVLALSGLDSVRFIALAVVLPLLVGAGLAWIAWRLPR